MTVVNTKILFRELINNNSIKQFVEYFENKYSNILDLTVSSDNIVNFMQNGCNQLLDLSCVMSGGDVSIVEGDQEGVDLLRNELEIFMVLHMPEVLSSIKNIEDVVVNDDKFGEYVIAQPIESNNTENEEMNSKKFKGFEISNTTKFEDEGETADLSSGLSDLDIRHFNYLEYKKRSDSYLYNKTVFVSPNVDSDSVLFVPKRNDRLSEVLNDTSHNCLLDVGVYQQHESFVSIVDSNQGEYDTLRQEYSHVSNRISALDKKRKLSAEDRLDEINIKRSENHSKCNNLTFVSGAAGVLALVIPQALAIAIIGVLFVQMVKVLQDIPLDKERISLEIEKQRYGEGYVTLEHRPDDPDPPPTSYVDLINSERQNQTRQAITV